MPTLHTVLGATGASGKSVLDELAKARAPIRAITRSSEVPGFDTVNADLLHPEATREAVSGSSHVYMCVGLPYRSDVWMHDWPLIMDNLIRACAHEGASLHFLDNIYMYGPPPLPVPFDEDTRQEPTSKKGVIRKAVADRLMETFAKKEVEGTIARSADFYGPGAKNSMLYAVFLERMLQGKAPQFLGPPDQPHTYGYTIDNARAMIALAEHPDTYGEVWHLPVGDPITPQQAADLFNQLLGTDHQVQHLPIWMQKALGLFMRPIREVGEMLYQFSNPYHMSWEKFQTRFPAFKPTPYKQGFQAMIDSFRS